MPRTMRLTRTLVEKIPSCIPDPGAMTEIAHLQTSEMRAEAISAALSCRPDPDEFWVFAFGSLVWNPCFEAVTKRRAVVEGWHRAFCLGPDTRYRGNPNHPGVMLSLDTGGHCDGIVYRLNEETLGQDLAVLFEREPPIPPLWLEARTGHQTVPALAFVCQPGGRGYNGGRSLADIARQIAPAVGMFGSMAEYVFNAVSHLQTWGIHDEDLWQMQDLVAAELERIA